MCTILTYFRYIESGVYCGITEDFIGPKVQELLNIPEENLLYWNVYTPSDFKLYCIDQKQKKQKKQQNKKQGNPKKKKKPVGVCKYDVIWRLYVYINSCSTYNFI